MKMHRSRNLGYLKLKLRSDVYEKIIQSLPCEFKCEEVH